MISQENQLREQSGSMAKIISNSPGKLKKRSKVQCFISAGAIGLRENNWFRLHFPRNRSPLNSTEYDDDEFYSDHLDSQMDELFSETEVQFGEMANEDSDPDNEFVPLIEQKLVEG